MAANPPLDEATEDPICLENEQLLIRREGITFEGVVAKVAERGYGVRMAKAKTQAWKDAVRARCGEKAQEIIDS